MDKTININGKTWYAEQTVQSKDADKLEHVFYILQRELNTAKELFEENKSLGFTVNTIEAEGCLRGLTLVSEQIAWDLANYFNDK